MFQNILSYFISSKGKKLFIAVITKYRYFVQDRKIEEVFENEIGFHCFLLNIRYQKKVATLETQPHIFSSFTNDAQLTT